MQISWHSTEAEFNQLKPAWNRLVEYSITHVPFLRHEYLSLWWETLGGGEWKAGKLFTAVGQDHSGEIQGIAPLFKPAEGTSDPRLMFLGSIEISDYLDIIAASNHLETFVNSLFESLALMDRDQWVSLDLYNLPDWSPSVGVLTTSAEDRGWAVQREIYKPCPVIELPDSWDLYLQGIKKKHRHELRRKLRRAEGYPEPVTFQVIGKDDDFESVIEDYLQLMSYDLRKQEFLTDPMRANIQGLVRLAMEMGYLLLVFLYVGSEPAAAYMHFDYLNRIWVYNSGINPKYLDLSPGWVLLGKTIQWGIENRREALDFMRGDEIYKYRLGGVDRHVLRLVIRR